MPLLSLHAADPGSVAQFTVDQVVSVAGDGLLKDNSNCSTEFRQYLQSVETPKLGEYVEQCLNSALNKGGLILQDLVNEVGRRLGYKVTNGRYQGIQNDIGFDGLWKAPEGNTVIAEVKTTDAYRLSLDTLATYRNRLEQAGRINRNSSILIITGRADTGELEAQIRGSRHAWDVRLISADSLVKLAVLREGSEAEETGLKIRSVLTPVEYTRLDQLVDVVFSTAQDVDPSNETAAEPMADVVGEDEISLNSPITQDQTSLLAIREKRLQVISALEHLHSTHLKKVTRALHQSDSANLRVASGVSKRYPSPTVKYWYAFHPSWQDFLAGADEGLLVLACLDKDFAFAIPLIVINEVTPKLNTTSNGNKIYWHIHLTERNGSTFLVIPKHENICLEQYKLKLD